MTKAPTGETRADLRQYVDCWTTTVFRGDDIFGHALDQRFARLNDPPPPEGVTAMVHTDRLMELFHAVDDEPIDDQYLRRLAYEAFDGDALALMTTLLRTIRSLSDQLAHFYGTSADDVLRIEAILPARPVS